MEHPNVADALKTLPEGCRRFVEENGPAFWAAPGSGGNHQAWMGGYAAHLDEVFGIALILFNRLSQFRELPFTFEDVLLVLFLHDVEKVFKRLPEDVERNPDYEQYASDPEALREIVMVDYGLTVTEEQDNALSYVHGELEDYSPTSRVAGPLSAFCHVCDYVSARIWFDEPLMSGPLV